MFDIHYYAACYNRMCVVLSSRKYLFRATALPSPPQQSFCNSQGINTNISEAFKELYASAAGFYLRPNWEKQFK